MRQRLITENMNDYESLPYRQCDMEIEEAYSVTIDKKKDTSINNILSLQFMLNLFIVCFFNAENSLNSVFGSAHLKKR